MKIKLNELTIDTDETTLFALRDEYKPSADIVIVNGYPVVADMELSEGDTISLITRGEVPSNSELEALLIARHTPDIHAKLKRAKVAIAGLGGLGSNIAISLARMGIGTLKLVDFDVVEPSNLNRQNYSIAQIGMKKTIATKENINAVTTITNVITDDVIITQSNIAPLFDGYDIIIEALDNPDTKYMLITEVIAQLPKLFIIGASGVAGVYDTSLFTERKISDRAIIIGDFINEAKLGSGLMATRVSVAANMQANIAIRKILGEI